MGAYLVRMEPYGRQFTCREDQTVLEAAEQHGLTPLFGCRGGNCGACKSQLLSGEMDYGGMTPWALSEEEMAGGMGLLCIGSPRSDLTIEVEPTLFSVREAAGRQEA